MISEESFVDFSCPHCGETVSCPAAETRLVQTCPSCSEPLLAPPEAGKAGRQIPLPITTERLVLRRLQGGDWKDLLEIMSDEEIFRYEETVPLDEDGVLRWLESEGHIRLTTPDQIFTLAIQLRQEEKVIGHIGLQFRDAQCQQANVTVYVARAFQQRDYALEGLKSVCSFCLHTLNAHRLTTHADSRNTAALELYERAGMKREGHFRKNRMIRGEWVDTVWFGMLAEDLHPVAQS
jgi:RimJ/RimL family protein N-acetyltransferase